LMIATVLLLLIGMVAISYLAEAGGFWGYAIAGLITAFVLAFAGNTFALARDYYLSYGRDGWIPPVMWSLSGLVVGGLVFAWLSGCSNALSNLEGDGKWTKFWKSLGMKKNVIKELFQKRGADLVKGAAKTGLAKGGSVLKDVIKEEMNPNSQTNQTDNKK